MNTPSLKGVSKSPADLTIGSKILYTALNDIERTYTVTALTSSKAPECERSYHLTLKADGKTCRVVMAEWARFQSF